MDSRILLRPFRPDELDLVWAARRRNEGSIALRRGSRDRLRRQLARSGVMHRGFLRLAIEAEGRLVGDVDARCPPDALPPGVFELGIELYEPADRGRGYGAAALALVVERLFAEEGAARVQASTGLGNVAMRRALDRTGFAFEGMLRAFMPAPEGREDYALYALTRDDWERRRARRKPS
jgi:RimJ/RimL family protein N-acetyltransferase